MLASILLPDGTATTLNYYVWGDTGARSTVMCVHGLTRNGLDFAPLAEALAAGGHRVIAPDMPGRGKSAWLADSAHYNNGVNASLCLQLLTQLGQTQVDWIGTSMGGMIAMLVAHQAPLLIRRLVLNDVGAMIPAAALARISEYVGQSTVFSSFAEAETLLRLRTQSFAIPPAHWQSFAKNSIEATANSYRLAYDPAIAKGFAAIDTTKDLELWPLWEAVKPIPTLLIRGEASDLLLEETAVTMQATHPRLRRLNIQGAGHAPSLMNAPEITTITAFLE